ncbi:MAG TPA: M23 family metallopeptidase [Ignavibacteriales bacterium]|nr:M23 family metallopeptidase [Ignavibacteriales bacterium]
MWNIFSFPCRYPFYNKLRNFVFLDHGFGLATLYIHMDTVYVNEGQRVAKGDILGEVGTTGRSTGPHLHWGALWYNKRVDPLSLFKINMDKPTVLK